MTNETTTFDEEVVPADPTELKAPETPDEERLARPPGAAAPVVSQASPRDHAAVLEGDHETDVNQEIMAAAAARKPAEEWAKAKGHLVLNALGQADVTAKDYWLFASAKAGENWPIGRELTEAEYDAAVAKAAATEVR